MSQLGISSSQNEKKKTYVGYFLRCGLDLFSGAVVIALLVTAGTRARAGFGSCARGWMGVVTEF
jgi:hypothetical protein